MPYSNPCTSAKIEYAGDGSTVLYTFPFEYTKQTDVKVYLWNDNQYELNTDWTFENATTIRFNTAPAASTNPVGQNTIRIVRETDIEPLNAQFYPGASIKAQDLNDNFEQLKFAVEENRCIADSDYWKKYEGTIHSNETWSGSDDLIATTAAIDAAFLRQDSTETINSGMSWSNSDAFVATTAAIDARIVDLVEEVGGFVPIDNETSFPLENPDINDGDGTLISIKEIAIDRGIGGGTVTITNGAGTNTVTITGVPTTGMLAGYGAIVETTSTLHTYAFHRLSPPAVEVTTVANNIGDVNTVATNITDVNTVANDITNVNTVATDITNVNTVATNITDVNAVAASIGDVNVVQDNIAAVVTVANDLNEPVSEIDTVANSIANVDIVGNDIANVNTTAGSIGNVNVVASQIGDVNAVAPSITDVTTVAGSIANVNTVATDITNVNAVGPNIANVNTVASNNTNVTTVATNVSDVNTTATNITNVNAVGTNITNVNTVAANISSVNDFAERYRISATAPTTSLDDGDLWWDTTSDTLKVYDATSGNWVTGVTDTAGFLATAGGTMTGALNITAGTAAGPGLAFDGDTNTGLYSPAADQVALTTGGTGRLFIDASGNVGIGTSTPSEELEVVGDIKFGSGSNTWLSSTNVLKSSSSQGAFLRAFVSTAANPTYAQVGDENTGVYFPAADALGVTTGGTERLRIDSSGNVGIGTSSPATKLHVSSSGDTIARITSADGNGAFLDLGDASDPDGGRIVYDSGSNLTFSTASSERMRIDSSGNVGIGTNGPASRLHLAQDSAHGIRLQRTGASPSNCYISNTSNVLELKNSASGIVFNTGGSETARIDSSGNVGIGTSAPSTKLHLVDASSPTILVQDTTNNVQAVFAALDSFAQAGTGTNHDFRFLTNNTERLRIDSSGRVGIGTTGPNYDLTVVGTTAISGTTYLTSGTQASPGEISINYAGDNADAYIKAGSTAGVWSAVQITGNWNGTSNTGGKVALHTAGTERMRIDGSGNVGIGTSSPGSYSSVANNLVVQDTAGEGGITIVSTTTGSSNIFFADTDSASQGQIKYQHSGDYMRFYTANAERLRIDSSGNVGIGITPTAKLHVNGTIQSSVGSHTAQMYSDGGASFFTSVGAYPSVFYTNGSERLRIDSSGNVGVGVSSPSNLIQATQSISRSVPPAAGASGHEFALGSLQYGIVAGTTTGGNSYLAATRWDGTATNYNLLLQPNGGSVGIGVTSPAALLHLSSPVPTLRFTDSDTNGYSQILQSDTSLYIDADRGASGSGALILRTNGTNERLRIDSSGRVGIGNSSPTQELCVRSTAGTEADILLEGDNGASGGLTVFHNAFDCGLYNSSNTSMRFSTNGTERFRIGPAGQFGLSGVNYGTSGQVLTSNGSSSAPTWQDITTLSTAVTLSSNNSVTFTDVPSWAGKIIVMLGDVDTNASQHIRVKLGTSGGVISTGYVQSTHNDGGGGSNSSTDAFYWFNNSSNAGFSGLMTITKLSSTEYCQSHAGRFDTNGGNHGGGYLSGISGTIDRVEISIAGGSLMTSGRINVRYEQ